MVVLKCSIKMQNTYLSFMGEGKMTMPLSLVVCRNSVHVSQMDNSILSYQLDGEFISKLGHHVSDELEFRSPRGLTADDSNGGIYYSCSL